MTIREWAKDNGYEVGQRGRLPKVLIVNYLMAHPAEARQFLVDSHVVVGKRGRISRKAVETAVGV